MQIQGAVVVVTGAASGIGRAMARRFAADGASIVYVADLDGAGAAAVAEEIGGVGVGIDVTDEAAIVALIEQVERDHGPIDLWAGNAGIGANGGVELGDDEWNANWNVNVLAHVKACRHLVPVGPNEAPAPPHHRIRSRAAHQPGYRPVRRDETRCGRAR